DEASQEPKDQALAWLAEITTGGAGKGTLAEFEQWRRADPRNEQALKEARALWLMIGKSLEQQYTPNFEARAKQRANGISPWRLMLAAAAVLVMVAFFGNSWLQRWRFDQVTAIGEQRAVPLEDGSTMWLNTDSAVDIDMSQQQRHVRLAR